MLNPQLLLDFSVKKVKFNLHKKTGNFYPGIRLLSPREYLSCMIDEIIPILNAEFNIIGDAEMTKADCSISLLTLKPEELNNSQSLPNFDSANPN